MIKLSEHAESGNVEIPFQAWRQLYPFSISYTNSLIPQSLHISYSFLLRALSLTTALLFHIFYLLLFPSPCSISYNSSLIPQSLSLTLSFSVLYLLLRLSHSTFSISYSFLLRALSLTTALSFHILYLLLLLSVLFLCRELCKVSRCPC